MKKVRAVMFVLCILLLLSIAASCMPVEEEKPFVSGLGTTINAYQEYGGWVYYIDYPSCNLYRVKSNGEKKTVIIDEPVHSFVIYENKIFYTNWKFYVYTSDLDGSNDKKLYSINEELLADGTIRAQKMQIVDGWIYALCYGELYKFKTDGSDRTIIKLEAFEDFYIEEDKMYYYSIPLKAKEYPKWQIEEDENNSQPLLQEYAKKVDYDDNWVYYISPDDSYIYKVSLDGREKYQIAQCNATYIKVIGDWIYYEQYTKGKGLYTDIYIIRKDGSENTFIKNDIISFHGIFDNWFLCYGVNEISAIYFGEASETEELTYDIISGWPNTTIYE